MKKTAILIDSTFLMEREYIKENNIYTIPLNVNFHNATFKDGVDKENLLEEIFTKINKDKEIPKTSQPAVQDFLNIYENIKADGYERIISFYMTSKLSGTYQGAVNAANIYMEENKGIEIESYDSLNVSISTIAVKDIINYYNITGHISKETIEEKLEYYKENTKVLLVVDSLEYLALGGRISSSVAAIGNLFGIKPLLEIKDGEILEYSKVRSEKKAYKKILEVFEEEVLKNKDKIFMIGSCHVLEYKKSKKMLNNMKKILENHQVKYEESFLDSLGAVIATHLGPKSIGIGWSIKND